MMRRNISKSCLGGASAREGVRRKNHRQALKGKQTGESHSTRTFAVLIGFSESALFLTIEMTRDRVADSNLIRLRRFLNAY